MCEFRAVHKRCLASRGAHTARSFGVHSRQPPLHSNMAMTDAPPAKKRAPNRLVIDDSGNEGDNSCIMLSLKKMEGMYGVLSSVGEVGFPRTF